MPSHTHVAMNEAQRSRQCHFYDVCGSQWAVLPCVGSDPIGPGMRFPPRCDVSGCTRRVRVEGFVVVAQRT